jgi:release factor glutamine methyltransferase
LIAARAGRVGATIRDAAAALSAAGVDSPRLDAELLLAEAVGVDRARLAAGGDEQVPAAAARGFEAMLRRRLAREPVAYILGRKGFRRIELEVDPRALIPRPETELLVEVALEVAPRSVLDVGTGSGSVALAVADELPACEVVGTDVSAEAIELARRNAGRLGLADRVRFEVGELPVSGSFDLTLANLPYVRAGEWPDLEPEITRYEPRGALVAGEDGLGAIRSLIEVLAPRPRRPPVVTGTLALEVGAGQAPAVAGLLRGAGFGAVEARTDLGGVERVLIGRTQPRGASR